jgi:hypothetical protein
MPGFLYHANATALCPHGGQVTVFPLSSRVLVSGQPVATMADPTVVTGCTFAVPPGHPHPCVQVRWLVPAARILVNGQPALLQTSTGICQSSDQVPQGSPIISVTQTRVTGI